MAPKLNLLARFRKGSADDRASNPALADGPAWRNRRPWYDRTHVAAAVGIFVSLAAGLAAHAGDILRGGAPAGTKGTNSAGGAIPAQAAQANTNAKDALARTTQAVQSVKALQKAARNAAVGNNAGLNLPDVPNGLTPGGLQVAPGVPANLAMPAPGENAALWTGATLPSQTSSGGKTTVTVRQTKSQALLTWQTFNVGKDTTLNFDQSLGGERRSEWIAFNKVVDPSGRPSQILGAIKADGQVYVINQNGIIFGGASQINTRTFVASALPINDNLIQQGLLNNPDAQFLFSALTVPGGSSGTAAFNPSTVDPLFTPTAGSTTYTLQEKVALTKSGALVRPASLTYRQADGSQSDLLLGIDYTVNINTASKQATVTFTPTGLGKLNGAAVTANYTPAVAKTGNITVQAGATISSPVSNDGNGGRVMLVGANVSNAGTISTPAGQTILASGLQLGVAAHLSTDPSLRGLDAYVGAVAEGTGRTSNSGLIEAFTGSVAMTGRYVDQLGAIESTTSVNLNGRIDLFASYGAVGNPSFASGIGTPFVFQKTGVVELGKNSSTRILPDYASKDTVPGTALPQRSQINIEGQAIHMDANALLMAPNADVRLRAGMWPYVDIDGNRTTVNDSLLTPTVEANLASYFLNGQQRFLLSTGQIYLDPKALITVAGSTDVLVPLAQSILNVELRGNEFADSPLQRDGVLRGVSLTIDVRKTGVFSGQYWMGTPLGNATGLAGLIQRNVAQLTAAGGNVTLLAGGSIVVQKGATVDVSGGYFQHEGGMVNTTRLLQQGRLVDIADARPDQIYDGVFTGTFQVNHPRYGLTDTFTIPLLSSTRYEASYIEGAAGGSLTMNAPSMAVDGELLGLTVEGPRQRSERAAQSRVSFSFESERSVPNTNTPTFGPASPTPPTVKFDLDVFQLAAAPAFTLTGDTPSGIGAERQSTVILSPELLKKQGFGSLTVYNPDGDILIPNETSLEAPARGAITLSGKNVQVLGNIAAKSGQITLKAYNLSPYEVADFRVADTITPAFANPAPRTGRGLITLASGSNLDASGLLVDDRIDDPATVAQPLALAGGTIVIESYSANLAAGSAINASGGARIVSSGQPTFGAGGSISILTGRDLTMTDVTGGTLQLGATLSAYSGGTGGSLSLRAMSIQLGGSAPLSNTVLLSPEFFRQGGFTTYALTGIGEAAPTAAAAGSPDAFIPAISVAAGTTIAPAAESWLVGTQDPSSRSITLSPTLREVGVRAPASISLTALGSDDAHTLDKMEARGDIVIGAGAQIITDPGSTIALEGQTATVLGALTAPGGTISIKGAARFPGTTQQVTAQTSALPTVFIGSGARISTAGTAILLPDPYGRRIGSVSNGGIISVYGNIVAASGAVMDVSGSSAILDVTPAALGQVETPGVTSPSGVNSPLEKLRTVPTLVDSNGGLLELEGAQLLLSDATLLGRAGGASSAAGVLSIHSGRFYRFNAQANQLQGVVTNADINLVVTQSGKVIPNSGSLGIGQVVLSSAGTPLAGMGYFAIDRFTEGGFDSLELGAKFLAAPASGTPLAGGGNIQFVGPVTIKANGYIRLAAGGVIDALSPVNLQAPYIAIGRPFVAPQNPADATVVFQQSLNGVVSSIPFAPTAGAGNLTLNGSWIDIGTLSLRNIGTAALRSTGDIRGNGTLAIEGDLTLQADQIYPTTLSTFNVVAYDPAGRKGSITILGGGPAATPLSVGGTLNLFASTITQAGVLKAPLGSITIGWDGKTDYDTSDADIDAPTNPVVSVGTNPRSVPTTTQVALQSGSVTSVAAIDNLTGAGLLLPFGLSPDGFTWIDPRGVNVTSTGVPAKQVIVLGENVAMQTGATVDVRGGGDLYAYRSVLGVGGSADQLGTAATDWTATKTYQPGNLVIFNGQTWTARTASTGQQPAANLYWSRVNESFAIIPTFTASVAPYNPYYTGTTSQLLQGDPGYVFTPNTRSDRLFTSLSTIRRTNTGMQVGDQVYLNATADLPAGTYTLLPRRYALLPGAVLVTPQTGEAMGTFSQLDGSTVTTGYRTNAFTPTNIPELQTRFEVASAAIVRSRSDYTDYLGNAFFTAAAERLEIARPQLLPMDAGYVEFHGNSGLSLNGTVLTKAAGKGIGASIDVSSYADLYLTTTGNVPAGAKAVLNPSILSSWGAESLLVGGVRRISGDSMLVDVRTSNLVLDNPNATFVGPEITLASKIKLTLTAGSSISSTGTMVGRAEIFNISGDGTLLRVSTKATAASVVRSNVTASTAPLLEIGAGASLTGPSVILDSTYGTRLDPTAVIAANNLTLGSGQISIVVDPSAPLTGSVVSPHLVVTGKLLEELGDVSTLSLRSYRTIDLYGAGVFGNAQLQHLELLASGLRGYGQGGGDFVINAADIVFANPNTAISSILPAPVASSGGLQINAGTMHLGAGDFTVYGYTATTMNAFGGIIGQGKGSLSVNGNLTFNTPVITGERSATQAITATGALALNAAAGKTQVVGGLGATFSFTGASVVADTAIQLSSGRLTLHAKTGDVVIGGKLDLAGTTQEFYDLTRYSDAGNISLVADAGDVRLETGGTLDVSGSGLGRAGVISVEAAQGEFLNQGSLLGSATQDANAGTFLMDVSTIPDYASVNGVLEAGGFFKERNIRVRTGSVTIDGSTRARDFTLSADAGSIVVTGTIDASGTGGIHGSTGGKIVLAAGGSLSLQGGALLTVHAADFSSAGKGGAIRLEAGAAVNGVANTAAILDLQTGSTIDLGVDTYVAGAYTDVGSSAFFGKFQGTLHLRAPQVGNDVRIGTLGSAITGASAILAEGFRVYDRSANTTLDTALLNTIKADATSFMGGYGAMEARLLATQSGLQNVLIIAPGAELYSTGNLTLGTDAEDAANDWNLSSLRFGPKNAPGVLTMRAGGNIEFKNALSDGFAGDFSPNDFGSVPTPGQELWLRPLMDIASTLPTNLQSWSYRITAGSDLSAADFRQLRPIDQLGSGAGSITVGKYIDMSSFLADPIATTAAVIDNRFQVVRTGAGDIEMTAGRDVQLLNPFASVYTAGVRLPYSNAILGETEVRLMSIYSPNDFAVPLVEMSNVTLSDSSPLGAIPQAYAAQYAMAGGSVTINAQQDIARMNSTGIDSSHQLPNNWLYRRGYVDPTSGRFGDGGPVGITDLSASTTWWVDYSSFFEGFGALGGGNVTLTSGRDIINADAVAPTNARMAGRNALTGENLAPDASNLLQLGGGDVTVKAGRNIDGGVYYVERGQGTLSAGGEIKTNAAQSPSLPTQIQDPLTWLPTTLFVGQSQFDVTATGNILLGPVTNPFLLPQGVNNRFYYKTYFNTYSEDAGVTVASFGGSVTHRLAVNVGSSTPTPALYVYLSRVNAMKEGNISYYQPWIRLAEAEEGMGKFDTIATIMAPSLQSTAFAGDINFVGNANLFPSPTGTLELAASGGVIGLQAAGTLPGSSVKVWTSAQVNLSDANPERLPGIDSPRAVQVLTGAQSISLENDVKLDPLTDVRLAFQERGSFSGDSASIVVKQALHGLELLHAQDSEPVRIYALGGNVTALTLFSSKETQVSASKDINDVAFYIQNASPDSISIVSAGRDIIPFNENTELRTQARNLARGNILASTENSSTVLGTNITSLAGDLQISGEGVLEVLAGRNLDLGSGANLTGSTDAGTGVGITSIGNARNPALPLTGADLIVFAGVTGMDNKGPALGLSGSSLTFKSTAESSADPIDLAATSAYLKRLGATGSTLDSLTEEQQAIVALEQFYLTLRNTGRKAATDGYATGFAAISALFGTQSEEGDVFTRTRDIRTLSGGAISLAVPGGRLTMASNIFGNPLTPPGIVTEFGGSISMFTNSNVDIGQARIFTLRGGNILIWSSAGNIAAGNAPKTVVTAPPTRVLIDATSAAVQTDLGGLATGGGIGVLASVKDVPAGDVDLIAPVGTVDAGDAGIRATGNLSIAAVAVLNASNIQVAGSSTGVPAAAPVASVNLGAITSASSTAAAGANSAAQVAQTRPGEESSDAPSIIDVQVLGYTGGE